jgi:hypothetical protein
MASEHRRSEPRRAEVDPALTARVTARHPLHYVTGVDAALDRPAFVRSGSSLASVPGGIAVIQDDANFLAVFDPTGRRTRAITLPAGKRGLRQFDDLRGNKKHRLDLEACVAVRDGESTILLAFGSGSSGHREQVLLVRGIEAEQPRVTLVPAPRLYETLRSARAFAGSELNIEGAIQVGGSVRLFSRGNGAPGKEQRPVDATCDIGLAGLLDHLADPERESPPLPGEIVQYELGQLGGIPLGFSDAAAWQGAVLYSAAAEASPDATRDGPVTGSAIGVISAEGVVRWAPLTDSGGALFSGKAEGLVAGSDASGKAGLFVILDGDDPGAASELCSVELSGPWIGSA